MYKNNGDIQPQVLEWHHADKCKAFIPIKILTREKYMVTETATQSNLATQMSIGLWG